MYATFYACLVGLFVIAAAAGNWNWYFEHPKARFFVNRFGRQGARLFYLSMGCVLILLGWACGVLA